MSLRRNERTDVRRTRYKVALDAEEGRRRRENNMVAIRKDKRGENLRKKRSEGIQAQQQLPADAVFVFSSDSQLESVADMLRGVYSEDRKLQLEGTTRFRKLLSIRLPLINEVAVAVPRFVAFLARDDFPQLQFEAAWALASIASGTSENMKVVIDYGAIPVLVRLLTSAIDDIREQTVSALGNIASNSLECCDLVLGHGALMPLLAQFNEHAKLSMLRNATWTLSIFCKGKPLKLLDQPALQVLERLIHSNDDEVLEDACWALSYLSNVTNDKIQAVIEAGVSSRLVELLLHPSPTVIIPALQTVRNIVSGDDMQTQCMINHQVLPSLFNLLTNNLNKSIQKEACWTISNITAGNVNQIQAVIEAGIIASLVQLLQSAEFDIKAEVAWAISNATFVGTREQIKFLVSQGCIKPMCDLLICPDPSIVTVCLEGLENILNTGEAEKSLGNKGDKNLYAQMIENAEGLEKIERLQSHDNNDINERAVKILEAYWVDDNENEPLPPGDIYQSGLQFGGDEPPKSPGEFNFG